MMKLDLPAGSTSRSGVRAGARKMINGLLGKKVGMTQLLQDDGTVVPVTVIQAGPCVVVQKRPSRRRLRCRRSSGFVEFVKPKRVNKPMTGHFKKANVAPRGSSRSRVKATKAQSGR
jgi:large subunit ribosomal protein L3